MADDGYCWWYVDAQSDDGQYALTLIAFVGSVFSPYYAWRRRRGPVAAAGHCALNAVFYGPLGRKRWSMTERGAGDLQRQRHSLVIGPSALRWTGQALEVELDEWCVPLPRLLRGRLRLHAPHLQATHYPLDEQARHRWRPIAPVARVEVELTHPRLRWQGPAYWDSNQGDEPLERAFRHWHWSRSHRVDGSCAVHYEIHRRDGSEHRLALELPVDSPARSLPARAATALPASPVWRIARAAGVDRASIVRTLEDTPFYCRSLLTRDPCDPAVGNAPLGTVHESLDLDRFASPWVQALLPFRMPRRLQSRR